MKIKYYSDTDSIYINLSDEDSKESKEIAPGIIIDFDKNHHITGIDIDNASHTLNLSRFEVSNFPSKKLIFSGK